MRVLNYGGEKSMSDRLKRQGGNCNRRRVSWTRVGETARRPLYFSHAKARKVFAVDINLAAAEETKEIIDQEGGNCTAHRTDVSNSEAVEGMVEKRCLETYGRIDILHNNVGILEVGGPVEASEESWGSGQQRQS